jgi:hypothetical protein
MTAMRKDDGKYDYSDMGKPCRCGHTLGVHAAAGDRDCMNVDEGDGEPCDCAKFKPAPPLTEGQARVLAVARLRGPGKPVGCQSVPGARPVHLKTLAARGYGTYRTDATGAWFYLAAPTDARPPLPE